MGAGAGWVGEKTGCLVFQGIVGFDAIRFVLSNDVWGAFADQTFELDTGRIGVWVEDAYYVGDIFI